MRAWARVNSWLGFLLLGVPAVAAVLAVVSTIGRFGVATTFWNVTLPALILISPLALWAWYVRHRPTSLRQRIGWAMIALVTLGGLAWSPVWGWAIPAVLLLGSEIVRGLVASTRQPERGTARR